MADGFVLGSNNRLEEAYIYEGERIAVEYPDGTTSEIAPQNVHKALRNAFLPDGEPCQVLLEKTPLSRYDIVVLDK